MANLVEIIIKATDQASAVINSVKTSIGQYGNKINDVSKALTGYDMSTLASIAGVKVLIDQYGKAIDETMEYAQQVRTLARDIGGTPQEISKLIQAADDAQVSFESLKTAMVMANKQGTDVTIEGLQKLADKYLAIQDPLQRTKFLTDTFGRSGESMGALMEKGGAGIRLAGEEAEKYGRILDEQAIAETEDYRIAVDGLQDSLGKLKDNLALDVIPVLTDTLSVITPVVNAYNDFKDIIDKVPTVLKPLVASFDMMLNPIKAVTGPLYYLIDGFKELFKLNGKKVEVEVAVSTSGQTSRGNIYTTNQTGTSRGSIYNTASHANGISGIIPESYGYEGFRLGNGDTASGGEGIQIIPKNQTNVGNNDALNATLKSLPKMIAREIRQLEKYQK